VALEKMAGWERLGGHVDGLMARTNVSGNAPSFVVATDYGTASQIAFYDRHHPLVLCADLGRRLNQYDIWGGWEGQRGRDALIVLDSPTVPEGLARAFERVDPIGPELIIEYGGVPVRRWHFFIGKRYDGAVDQPPRR